MDALRRYGTEAAAAAYRDKYRRSLLRRLSSRRELSLVDRALSQAGVSGQVLDCPCGAGRLVPVILRRASRVTAVDLSAAMLQEARPAAAGRAAFARASADALPFPAGAFDAAVCHRLLHHIADADGRVRLLRELRRVARRFVLVSFHDATTVKHRVRGRRKGGRSRVALSPRALAAEAAAAGLELVPPLRRVGGWFSLVGIALLRVRGAGGQ